MGVSILEGERQQRAVKSSSPFQLFQRMDHTVQDQGRDFCVTPTEFTCCFLSPLPFHCTTKENTERNSQTFQVVGSVLEVANQAHYTRAGVK